MISMILALGPEGLIGVGDKLPWYSKKDFEHFKSYTLNKTILFGDRTFFGLPKYPLKDRQNFVASFEIDTADAYYENGQTYWMFPSIREAIIRAEEEHCAEMVVCGGRGVYNYCLQNNLIDKVVLTEVTSPELEKLAATRDKDNVYMTNLKKILKNNFILQENLTKEENDSNGLKLVFTTWLKQ